jgi:hypothetical protein
VKPVQVSIHDPRIKWNPREKQFTLFYTNFGQLAWRTLDRCVFRLINHQTNQFRDYRYKETVRDADKGLPGWIYSEPSGTTLLVVDDAASTSK